MNRILAAACLSLLCLTVWGQSSPAEREQERQAKQARERHPGSTAAAPSRPAAVKTNGKKAKAPPARKGEAAVNTGR